MTQDIVVLSDVAKIRDLLPAWGTLHAKASGGPFSGASWIGAWFDAWPEPEATPAFGCAWRDGELVAGWPLGISRRKSSPLGGGVRRLHMLCDDKAGYHELLIAPGHEDIAEAMMAAYDKSFRGSLLDLYPLRDSPAHDAVLKAAGRQGYVTLTRKEIRTVHADCPDGWNAYLSDRSRDFRKSLRSSERKLEEAGGSYSLTTDLSGEGRAKLKLAMDLSARCWKAQIGTDLASDPALRSFIEAIFLRMGPEDGIALHMIELDGEAAASLICLYTATEAIGLVNDMDECHAKLSLGRLLIARAMEASTERGITSFDFLRSTPFTKRFATRETALTRARIMRRGSLTHARMSLEEALRPIGRSLRKRRQLKNRKRAGNRETVTADAQEGN